MNDDKPHCETGAVKNTETSLIDKLIPKSMQPYETRYKYMWETCYPDQDSLYNLIVRLGSQGWKYCYVYERDNGSSDEFCFDGIHWVVVFVRSYRHTIGDLLADLVKDMKNIPVKKRDLPTLAKWYGKTEEEMIDYIHEMGNKIEGEE